MYVAVFRCRGALSILKTRLCLPAIYEKLETSSKGVYELFKSGHHVVRRSSTFWAGLSFDLVIEQVLMRS